MLWMSILKHRDSLLWVSSLPVRGAEILINNIFRWASTARGAYKVNNLRVTKVKTSICSTMQTTSTESKTGILLPGLKDLWVVRRTLVFHLETAESNSIYSSKSNYIIKLLIKLEIKTITTCTRKCRVNLLIQFNRTNKLKHQLGCTLNINQPVEIPNEAINKAKWLLLGGAEPASLYIFNL